MSYHSSNNSCQGGDDFLPVDDFGGAASGVGGGGHAVVITMATVAHTQCNWRIHPIVINLATTHSIIP